MSMSIARKDLDALIEAGEAMAEWLREYASDSYEDEPDSAKKERAEHLADEFDLQRLRIDEPDLAQTKPSDT